MWKRLLRKCWFEILLAIYFTLVPLIIFLIPILLYTFFNWQGRAFLIGGGLLTSAIVCGIMLVENRDEIKEMVEEELTFNPPREGQWRSGNGQ